MSSCVLDASAVLALLNEENGSTEVFDAISRGAAISTVNLSEVVAKLSDSGMPALAIRAAIDALSVDTVDFDADLAYQAGLLRPLTRHLGLSFGDRACLALAQARQHPAVTTDRTWYKLDLGISIQTVR